MLVLAHGLVFGWAWAKFVQQSGFVFMEVKLSTLEPGSVVHSVCYWGLRTSQTLV